MIQENALPTSRGVGVLFPLLPRVWVRTVLLFISLKEIPSAPAACRALDVLGHDDLVELMIHWGR